jgi:hypothetical protein
MMENAVASLQELFSLFFQLYPLAVILLLIFTLLLKGVNKNESINWLHVFNTAMPWYILLGLLTWLYSLISAWVGQNPYEWYAFTSSPSFIDPSFSLWILIAGNLAGLLFFIRSLRINRAYILLFLLIQNYGLIMRLVISIRGDYLPSSFEQVKEPAALVISRWLFVIITLSLFYRLAYRRKKLPMMNSEPAS